MKAVIKISENLSWWRLWKFSSASMSVIPAHCKLGKSELLCVKMAPDYAFQTSYEHTSYISWKSHYIKNNEKYRFKYYKEYFPVPCYISIFILWYSTQYSLGYFRYFFHMSMSNQQASSFTAGFPPYCASTVYDAVWLDSALANALLSKFSMFQTITLTLILMYLHSTQF